MFPEKEKGGNAMKRTVWALVMVLVFAGACSGLSFADGQRQLGEAVLGSLTVKDGAVVVNVASGGCTDTNSFKVHVVRSEGTEGGIPHYVLTFERVAADDCKALLLNGVDLVFDLEKDLGLSGQYTLSVANRVRPGKKPQQ
jgi:hypothetical protein